MRPNGLERDCVYVVSTEPCSFGALEELRYLGGELASEALQNKRCYEVLFDRTERCEDCPALRATLGGAPQWSVIRDDKQYRVAEAEPTPSGKVRVRLRYISDATLRKLARKHFHETAQTAGLTHRELDVLDYLVQGMEPSAITQRLGIQPRTLKFHQTNLLRKLGLSSRAELIRLLTCASESDE